MEQHRSQHWADLTADRILAEHGDKDLYTCASGITPSGTVHVGNFREIISVDLVVRALRDRGRKVRFIYSWDDYDVFRKVPANMPGQEVLEAHLRMPITMVPDPWNRDSSYARHHERDVELVLPEVGIQPEYLYQAERYRAGRYAADMRRALERRERLVTILDAYRDEDHKIQGEWWPVAVFCGSCSRDTTRILGWDGEWGLSYDCESCGHSETGDLRTLPGAKLVWRVDWPMRWAREDVDFEPAGKDHHSQGGSFDTARHVVEEVYDHKPPVTFRYDFIGIKGTPGKMSSSKGKVVDLYDLLRVYQPEVVRFLFAGTRPNTEFTISFDLDVIKIYEDYDRTERIYWRKEAVRDEATYLKEKRIYELSQVAEVPPEMPYQIAFRHLCNLLQIHQGNADVVVRSLPDIAESQIPRATKRAECAWYWITECAPPEFRFSLRSTGEAVDLDEAERNAVRELRRSVVEGLDAFPDEKAVAEAIYAAAGAAGIDPKALFRATYQALIAKDQGPRLAGFLRIIGRERVLELLAGI